MPGQSDDAYSGKIPHGEELEIYVNRIAAGSDQRSEQHASDEDVDAVLTRYFVTAAADVGSGLLAEDVTDDRKALHAGSDLDSGDVSEEQAVFEIVDDRGQFGWSRNQ